MQVGNLICNGVARFLSKVYVNDSVTAPTFVGNLSGTATKATQDGSGNTITSTYATKAELGNAGGIHIGTSAPSSTSKLWIDTGNGGIAKYYNGSAWTTVKATWG